MTVSDGCYAHVLDGGGPALYRVRIEEQEARSTIGSGDAFLAGYIAARYLGRSPIECLRYGVACGAESIQHFGAGLIDPAGRSTGSCPRSSSSSFRSAPRSAEKHPAVWRDRRRAQARDAP